jgi:hypothetical protein
MHYNEISVGYLQKGEVKMKVVGFFNGRPKTGSSLTLNKEAKSPKVSEKAKERITRQLDARDKIIDKAHTVFWKGD